MSRVSPLQHVGKLTRSLFITINEVNQRVGHSTRDLNYTVYETPTETKDPEDAAPYETHIIVISAGVSWVVGAHVKLVVIELHGVFLDRIRSAAISSSPKLVSFSYRVTPYARLH